MFVVQVMFLLNVVMQVMFLLNVVVQVMFLLNVCCAGDVFVECLLCR